MNDQRDDLDTTIADYVAIVPFNKARARSLVHMFHEWVASEHPSVTQLDLHLCDEFMAAPWAQRLAEKTLESYRGCIHRYIRWRAGTFGPPGHWSRLARRHQPIPETASQYLAAAIEPNRRESTCQRYRDILREFHNWLQSRNVDIEIMARDDAVEYCQWLHSMDLAISTRQCYIVVVRNYLRYLSAHGHLTSHPDTIFIAADIPRQPPPTQPGTLSPESVTITADPPSRSEDEPGTTRAMIDQGDDLDAIIADYIAIVPSNKSIAQSLVHRFHEWIASEHPSITQLDQYLCDEFMAAPWAQRLAQKTLTAYRGFIHRYIRWRAGTFGPPGHWSRLTRHHRSIPEIASQYLAAIEPNRRESTCRRYRDILRELHNWLQSRNVDIEMMTRDDAVEYCQWIHAMGRAIATRQSCIVVVRSYLRYLSVHGHLTRHPDTIFISADIPRLPVTLPRALKPDVDRLLCRRLAESQRPQWRGLLVMRRTGIRVGELQHLRHDCVLLDPNGFRYLKVPLGKLNNERLVPLDDDTYTVIESLQQHGPPSRSWLIPGRGNKPLSYGTYRLALAAAADGIATDKDDAITSHRLRHTYATTLLNAGMSIPSIQRLLGHHSIDMTLRYACADLENVTKEYFAALAKTKDRYDYALPAASQPDGQEAAAALDEIARRIHRDAGDLTGASRGRSHRLARELKRIAEELQELGF